MPARYSFSLSNIFALIAIVACFLWFTVWRLSAIELFPDSVLQVRTEVQIARFIGKLTLYAWTALVAMQFVTAICRAGNPDAKYRLQAAALSVVIVLCWFVATTLQDLAIEGWFLIVPALVVGMVSAYLIRHRGGPRTLVRISAVHCGLAVIVVGVLWQLKQLVMTS